MNEDDLLKRYEKRQALKDKIIKEEVRNIEKELKSDDYKTKNLIEKSSLGEEYHNMIDEKDQIDYKHQGKFNKTYHKIDEKLFKVDAKVERKSDFIDEKIRQKQQEIEDRIGKMF